MDFSKEMLLNIPANIYQSIFGLWYNEMQETKYKIDYPISYNEGDGSINLFTIRMNKVGIMNDEQRNNDFMVMIHNDVDGIYKYAFQVTADPKTKKYGIASLMPQVYIGNIRNHHWTANRTAVCQDNHPVWVWRYGKNKEERGFFTINIHDTGGFWNSSLGCTVLADDEQYRKNFKAVLDKVKKTQYKDNVPVAVFQKEQFESCYNKVG